MRLKIRQYEISIAKIDDIDALLNLAESLFASSPYGYRSKFNHRKVHDTLSGIITSDGKESIVLCLWKDEELVGTIAACTFHPLWNNETMAAELFFYCKSKGGTLHLVNAYEDWARSIGCTAMQIGVDQSKRRTFKGFIAVEQMYTKRLD